MTSSDLRLGVVGDEQLAALLRSQGLDVVSAPAFDQAATAVSSTLRTGELHVVLVIDSEAAPTGTHVWARTTATKVPMAILRSGPASANLPVQDRALEVDLPADLGEVLTALGLQGSAVQGVVVGGQDAPPAPAPIPAPVADAVFEDVAPAPVPAYDLDFDDMPPADEPAQPAQPAVAVPSPSPGPAQPELEAQPQATEQPASLDDLFGSYAQSPVARRSALDFEDRPVTEHRAPREDLWARSSSLRPSPQPAPATQAPAAPPTPPPAPAAPSPAPADLWSNSSTLGQPPAQAPSQAAPAAPTQPVQQPQQQIPQGQPVPQDPVVQQPAPQREPIVQQPAPRQAYAQPPVPEPEPERYVQPSAQHAPEPQTAPEPPVVAAPVVSAEPSWPEPVPMPPAPDPVAVFEGFEDANPAPAPAPTWSQQHAPQAPPATYSPARHPAPAMGSDVANVPQGPQQGEEAPGYAQDPVAPVPSRREMRARQSAKAAAGRRPSTGGQVLVCMAGKGGVGKSSLALGIAQRAASSGPQGFRVTLVDANRGQGDLRTYLHLVNDNLPTIYDAAFTGDAAVAHSLPRDLNAARGKGKGYLGFAFVAAPPAECADPSVVTAGVYREVIEHARTVSDLVVVDTQIAEAYDTSEMFTRMLTPMLAAGSWALGISDLSLPGVANLLERLEALVDQGADPERVLVTLNRAANAQEGTLREIAARFDEVGRYLGCIGSDPELAAMMNLGQPIGDSAVIAPMVDAVLHQVTGLEDFDPARRQESRSTRRSRKGGLFSRRRAA